MAVGLRSGRGRAWSLRIDGISTTRAALRGVRVKTANIVFPRALYEEGELIMRASQRIVPVDDSNLMNSGNVKLPKIIAGVIVVELGYGSAAVKYAAAVHEIPPPPETSPGGRSARHKAPRRWKYLEVPLKAAVAGMDRRLARRVRAGLRSFS